MDKIKQYYNITNIKPDYFELELPLYRATKKRITLNGQELELFYNDELNYYFESDSDSVESEKSETPEKSYNSNKNYNNKYKKYNKRGGNENTTEIIVFI